MYYLMKINRNSQIDFVLLRTPQSYETDSCVDVTFVMFKSKKFHENEIFRPQDIGNIWAPIGFLYLISNKNYYYKVINVIIYNKLFNINYIMLLHVKIEHGHARGGLGS